MNLGVPGVRLDADGWRFLGGEWSRSDVSDGLTKRLSGFSVPVSGALLEFVSDHVAAAANGRLIADHLTVGSLSKSGANEILRNLRRVDPSGTDAPSPRHTLIQGPGRGEMRLATKEDQIHRQQHELHFDRYSSCRYL